MLIFITTVVSSLELSVFNEKVLNKAITSDEYIDGVYHTILDDMKTLSIPNGVEKNTYQKALTKDLVANDVRNYYKSKLVKKTEYDFSNSTKQIEHSLTDNVIKQFEKENIIVTEDTKDGIYQFVKIASANYVSEIKIDYLNYYNRITDAYSLALIISLAVATILVTVLILFIFQLNKFHHQSLRFLFFSFSSSALMIATLSIYISASNLFENISVTPKYFQNAIVDFLNSFLVVLWISFVILCMISALMLYLVKLKKAKELKRLEAYLNSPKHLKRKSRREKSNSDLKNTEVSDSEKKSSEA